MAGGGKSAKENTAEAGAKPARPSAGKLSLVLCEVALTVSCLRSGLLLHQAGAVYASKGMLFVGLASSLGALRFGGLDVGVAHDLWSRLATTVGIPLLGLQYLSNAGWNIPAPTIMRIFFVAAAFELGLQAKRLREPVETLLGAAAMGTVAVYGQTPYFGKLGAGAMVAAVVVGTSLTRKTLFLWNMDLFHLLLATAMTLIRLDLTVSQ